MTYNIGVPVQLVGGSNQNRSRGQSSERTLNLYPEPAPSGAYPSILLPWPGTKTLGTSTTGTARGIYTHDKTGEVYKVVGSTLYKVDLAGTETSIGTILGSGLVLFDSINDTSGTVGVKLLIASNTAGYVYNITSNTLTQVTDASYEAGGSVVQLNNFVIWELNNNQYAVADVGNPLSIQAENISTKLSVSDDIVQIFRFKETIYMMGSQAIQPYYIGSTGTNPLVNIQSGVADKGLIARGCVDANENAMYWVGGDKVLYRATAYFPETVTTPSIANKLSDYDFTDASVRCIKFDNQNFVIIQTTNGTLAYCEASNLWIELAYGEDEDPYIGYDFTYAYGKNLLLSRIDGVLLELDQDLFTDNGQTIIRERITAPLNASSLGKNGGRIISKRAELIMESGVGNTTNPVPLVMMSHSIDYGQSFSNEHFISAGRDAQNNIRVEYYEMINARQIQYKIRTSAANFYNFSSLAVDIKMGGNY